MVPTWFSNYDLRTHRFVCGLALAGVEDLSGLSQFGCLVFAPLGLGHALGGLRQLPVLKLPYLGQRCLLGGYLISGLQSSTLDLKYCQTSQNLLNS